MDLEEARASAAAKIKAAGIERPWFEADLIISSLTGYDRAKLHREPHMPFPEETVEIFMEAVSRRAEREPLQYILRKCQFMDLSIAVGPGCLIPRPETEMLVMESRERFHEGVFLDWGTGSGAVAAAILIENPQSRCVAVEREPMATMWAWKNLKSFGLLDRCLLWHSPDIGTIPVPDPGFDMIVANPPYICTSQIRGLMPEVSGYEPLAALDGGPDGLDPYRLLLPWSASALKPGGFLIIETGDDSQARDIGKMLPGSLRLESVTPDLQGISRVLVLKRLLF